MTFVTLVHSIISQNGFSRVRRRTSRKATYQLNETMNDFITGNNTNMGVTENENLEQQANGRHRDFEGSVDNASQNQVFGNNTDDRLEMQLTARYRSRKSHA